MGCLQVLLHTATVHCRHAPILILSTALSLNILVNLATLGSEACSDAERTALLTFRQAAVEADPGGWLASWRNATDCCLWRGVRCDSAAVVTGLLLSNCAGVDPTDQSVLQRLHENNALHGSLTSAVLTAMAAGLPGLSRLDLGCHLFYGRIPPEIGNFTSLVYLDLSFQGQSPPLSGHLPATLWSLANLEHLDLGYNSIQGNLPDAISNSTRLSFLALTTNNLSDSIPPSLANLSRLTHLDLSSNAGLAIIPPSWSRPSFNLQILDLSWCAFSGPFPFWLSSQTNLSRFSLAANQFSGPLPDWAWSLASDFLDLSLNSFSGTLGCSSSISPPATLNSLDVSFNRFTGSIPCNLRNLSYISTLSLGSNHFTGPIHPFFGNLTQLSFLDLSGNQLEGPIPSMETLSSLEILDFDSNLLSGEFPASLLQLPALERLDISFNALSGYLPGAPPNPILKYLKLSHNSLTGSIPPSLSGFVGLKILRLDANNFTGLIPKSISALSGLQSLDLRQNSLERPLPLEMGNMTSLVFLSVSENSGIKGPFPACAKPLSQLLALDLRSINMEGEIPIWLGSALQQLQILLLAGNLLTSRIPATLGLIKGMKNPGQTASAQVVEGHQELLDDLVITIKGQSRDFSNLAIMAVLDLSRNKLAGAIPTELGHLEGLIALDLSSNRLDGGIPESLANLRALESLDMSDNMLEGGIPADFRDMTALSFVNLSSNRLTGAIPNGGQWSTFNASAFAKNKGLCVDSTHGNRSASSTGTSTSSSVPQLPQCSGAPAASNNAPPPPTSTSATGLAQRLNEHVSWNGFAVGYPFGVLLFFLVKLAFKRRLYIIARFRRVRATLAFPAS